MRAIQASDRGCVVNEKSAWIEQALETWAWHARGCVYIGHPGCTAEQKAIFGSGGKEPDWPEDAIEVEKAILALDDEPREAIKLYYIRHRHINSIARTMRCHQRKVSDLLNAGRRHVGGWLMARESA